MAPAIIYVVTSFILLCSALTEDSVVYPESSLSTKEWKNKGTLNHKDISDFGTGTVEFMDDPEISALCWENPAELIIGATIIDYNINSDVSPQLTMEAWIYPTGLNNVNWILGSDNGHGEWNRGIIINAGVPKGRIVLGTGHAYPKLDASDSVPHPELNEWTHIVGVWNDAIGQATVYKNGGALNLNGGSQATDLNSKPTNGYNTNVVLNGRGNGENYFTGCIARVEITNVAKTDQQVFDLYQASVGAFLGTPKVKGGGGGRGGGVGGGRGLEDGMCCALIVTRKNDMCADKGKNPCEKNEKCQWIACALRDEYLNDLDASVLSRDMKVNNGGIYGYGKNIKMYGLSLFIVMGAILVIYNCYKYSGSKKGLSEEANVEVLHEYGSIIVH